MEIRRVLRGENTSFSAARPTQKREEQTAVRPSADRLELSRQWTEHLEQQRAQAQAALLRGGKPEEKQSNGILDMLDGASAEEEELDALSEQLKVQQRCLKIAMRIMQGKKVPPEDERYLMENDPDGYKLAIAMRRPPKKDEKECESVLKDEDKDADETSESGEAAPVEGGEAPSGGGEAPSSGGGEKE